MKQKWGRACFDIKMWDQELNVHEGLMKTRLLAKSLYLKKLWTLKRTIILYVMGSNIKPYYQCASIAIIDVLGGDLGENIFDVGASIELKSLHIHWLLKNYLFLGSFIFSHLHVHIHLLGGAFMRASFWLWVSLQNIFLKSWLHK